MFLGAYHFDGDPAPLLAAYDRLRAGYPADALDLHICVERRDGITVLDTCPSREVFEVFSTGSDFAAALAAAGLPTPRIDRLGDVRAALLRKEVP